MTRVAMLAAITGLVLAAGAVAAGTHAVPSGKARFLARADTICLAVAGAERRQAQAVDTALTAYTTDDTAATRNTLAGELAGFFVQRFAELTTLEALSGTAAQRASLRRFETDTYFLVAVARPFIDAVDADDAHSVDTYAESIGSLAEKANAAAVAAGLLVCGSGSGYTVELRSATPVALAPGAIVSLKEGGRLLPRAGEVLAEHRAGGVSVVLLALATRDAPLRRGATAAVGRGAVALVDGPAHDAALADESTLTLARTP